MGGRAGLRVGGAAVRRHLVLDRGAGGVVGAVVVAGGQVRVGAAEAVPVVTAAGFGAGLEAGNAGVDDAGGSDCVSLSCRVVGGAQWATYFWASQSEDDEDEEEAVVL